MSISGSKTENRFWKLLYNGGRRVCAFTWDRRENAARTHPSGIKFRRIRLCIPLVCILLVVAVLRRSWELILRRFAQESPLDLPDGNSVVTDHRSDWSDHFDLSKWSATDHAD